MFLFMKGRCSSPKKSQIQQAPFCWETNGPAIFLRQAASLCATRDDLALYFGV